MTTDANICSSVYTISTIHLYVPSFLPLAYLQPRSAWRCFPSPKVEVRHPPTFYSHIVVQQKMRQHEFHFLACKETAWTRISAVSEFEEFLPPGSAISSRLSKSDTYITRGHN